MNRLFTIGEMAKLFGMSAKTLRYYDEAGLVRPERTEPSTGYRYYSTQQFERLNTVKYLRALDMPLAKIRRFFDNRDTDEMIAILQEQKQEVRRRKEELNRIERKIDGRLAQLGDAMATVYKKVRLVSLPERRLALLRTEIPVTDDLEVPIRQLERETQLEAAMFLGKVGVSIDKAHVLSHQYDEFAAIFVILEPEDVYEGECVVLPEGDYLTLRYCGTHTKSSHHYERLLQAMEEQGYSLEGGSIEITLIDAGITNDASRFVTELQLPVRLKTAYP